MELRFDGTGSEAARAIREGFRIWQDAGLNPEHYRQATVRFGDGSVGRAWRWLSTS